MRIVVLLKSVPDTAMSLELAGDRKSIVTEALDYVLNPYDEFALEQAVRLKETLGGDVIAVSMGEAGTAKVIRQALAVGVDSAVQVTGAGLEGLTACATAKVLAAVVKELEPDLLFAGKQAVDDDASQVPERVAELLGLPHVSAISRFELNGCRVTVDRQLEGGHHTLVVDLPALLTTEKGLNVPRYPKLPDILKAKHKEIRHVALVDTGLVADQLEAGLEIVAMALPKQRRSAEILSGEIPQQVGALVELLKAELAP